MANLTLSLDAEVLKRARIRALEDGTSVNSVVRDFLADFAGGERSRLAVTRFLEIAARSDAASGRDGRTWTREELYEGRGHGGEDVGRESQ